MTGPWPMRRFFACLALLAALPVALAQAPHPTAQDAIRALASPGMPPVMADPAGPAHKAAPVAAIVPLGADQAVIVVAAELGPGRWGIVTRSRPFTRPGMSNHGSAIESFAFTAPDRLALSLGVRSGCARNLVTHRFALRQGTWLVTGLDQSAMRCTDRGVEPDWAESANYLGRQAERTDHPRQGPPRTQRRTGGRQAFPLADFPPNGPESAYAEMQ